MLVRGDNRPDRPVPIKRPSGIPRDIGQWRTELKRNFPERWWALGRLRQGVGTKRKMRSSFAVGEPRPSRLLVATHSAPSGAVTTVRRRPN